MSKQDWGVDDPEETWWYNRRTGEVEEGPKSLSMDRLGPFSTREEASRANEIIAERAKHWAEEDARED